MKQLELRNQRLSDAKRFFEILTDPRFKFFIRPASLEAQKDYLRKNAEKRRKNIEHNYSIIYEGKLVGGCGIKINQHREYIGEIGYLVDADYWGKGIAVKAVKLLEKIGFSKLKLTRIEIVMNVKNKQSIRVAEKAGYKKEGLCKKLLADGKKKVDAYLYAKVK